MSSERKKNTKADQAVLRAEPESITDLEVLDREDVERLAHSYWQARNTQEGTPEEDWFRAERELGSRPMAACAD